MHATDDYQRRRRSHGGGQKGRPWRERKAQRKADSGRSPRPAADADAAEATAKPVADAAEATAKPVADAAEATVKPVEAPADE